jgi:hypothetical protein
MGTSELNLLSVVVLLVFRILFYLSFVFVMLFEKVKVFPIVWNA